MWKQKGVLMGRKVWLPKEGTGWGLQWRLEVGDNVLGAVRFAKVVVDPNHYHAWAKNLTSEGWLFVASVQENMLFCTLRMTIKIKNPKIHWMIKSFASSPRHWIRIRIYLCFVWFDLNEVNSSNSSSHFWRLLLQGLTKKTMWNSTFSNSNF